MKIISFSKTEFAWVLLTLAIIILATTLNLAASKRRSRDAQRKADLRSVVIALDSFKTDFESYPLSADGKILACGQPEAKNGQYYFNKCNWGQDAIKNFTLTDSVYIQKLPADPHQVNGVSYIYQSDGKNFELFASLEDASDEDYNPQVANQGIWCGNKVCNFEINSQ